MQTYIFIGGNMDSLSVPLPDEPESIKLPDSILNKVIYRRDTLRVGDASITFYRHEEMPPEEVIDRLIAHYKAWAVNQPGSHLRRNWRESRPLHLRMVLMAWLP